jgi:hypothetical protein
MRPINYESTGSGSRNTAYCCRYFTDLGPLLLILLLLRLEPLLVPDELLLHEEIVLDPLLLEEPQPALGVRGHARQLVRRVRSLHPHVTGHFATLSVRVLAS